MNALITWAGEELVLMPERAIWWPRERTFFIADPHFGKAATFRAAGIAVPETAQNDDIARLEILVNSSDARRLVILGDFFHAKSGRGAATLRALADWRERQAHIEVVLIPGNHDSHAGRPPPEWRIETGPQFMPPFHCCHEPHDIPGGFVLAGHIHPAYRLFETNGTGLRSPCFHFRTRVAVLPAFGSFTGSHTVKAEPGDRIFVIGPDAVIDVSSSIRKRTPATTPKRGT